MTIQKLKTFLEAQQNADGNIRSENSTKTTAEYLLVHRFCPDINVGNPENARTYLIENLPAFAISEVKKGFKLMERIWQIAVGIPDDTQFLSDQFLDLSLSCVPVSVKSSVLLVLFLQKVHNDSTRDVLEEVKEYQQALMKTVSLNTLYETTHNLMTFHLAREWPETEDIITQSCAWLSKNVFSFCYCIDLLAETAGVIQLCGCKNEKGVKKMTSILRNHQNEDGGFPVFAGGNSEFHPSLVALWALTVSDFFDDLT